ncbi:uncharacterized protein MEPE_03543 [Melanopsichium pennsylvanicum]|uniref:Uncharacterized protein n=2 Tax=Melanopsichium pennsylvanicum TaxID=63383 RepID=A0AAJ4XL70_9BASI|nr:putative protein [Melanopsichium pennsylvanicum 4]SNX84834.1 uncharacterized protein MEPE_03543 [Melanopsichium pennsylvanicum]
MQADSPTPPSAPHNLSPTRPGLASTGFGPSDAKPTPANVSPRRLRRSPRLSGAVISSPQNAFDKENIASSLPSEPSTSAKTLDAGVSENSPCPKGFPLFQSPTRRTSPLRSRSSPTKYESALGRTVNPQSDDILSSSYESDDSVVVFFGKPSSAEKKKRLRYEQRVLEKRLKHKDSLDLARRRPISFNPDDTMLVDETMCVGGWSWNKAAPTPLRNGMTLLSSPTLSASSPTQGRSSARNFSSRQTLTLFGSDRDMEQVASPRRSTMTMADVLATPEETPQHDQNFADSESPQDVEEAQSAQRPVQERQVDQIKPVEQTEPQDQGDAPRKAQPDAQRLEAVIGEKANTNPFIAAKASPCRASKSPSKHRSEFPSGEQSPVRLIESLIGATMAQNKEFASPVRPPRRSPKLSLEALKLSTSPKKCTGKELFFSSSTPFRQSMADQQGTPLQHATPSHQTVPLPYSTPFRQPSATLPFPPSTGLSRFACLQNISPITSRVPETPSKRALSMRFAQHEGLPSPFISSGLSAPVDKTSIVGAERRQSPSRSVGVATQSPIQGQRTVSQRKHSDNVDEPAVLEPRSASPFKTVLAPGTLSVRSTEPELVTTPNRAFHVEGGDLRAAHLPLPVKATIAPDTTKSPEQGIKQLTVLLSPIRNEAGGSTAMPCTPPTAVTEAKPETPGPVFRQTARRVPVYQHEADFGVKVSPAKASYSPHKAYANSSARSNEYGTKADRVPARRVQMQPPTATRQVSAKQGDAPAPIAARIPSVASKASRAISAGAVRLGGQSTSLPAAAFSRNVSAASPAPAAVSTQATSRLASSLQGSSVASKASRLHRPASAVFGNKLSSPTKQAKTLSGLPRRKTAAAAAPAAGPGSRLPRPATLTAAANTAKPTSRPVPMAIARLAPSQRAEPSATAPRAQTTVSPTSGSPAKAFEVLQQAETPSSVQKSSPKNLMRSEVEAIASRQATVATKRPEERSTDSVPPRRQMSSSGIRASSAKAGTQGYVEFVGQEKMAKPTSTTVEAAAPARSSSPVVPLPPARPPSSARSTPHVIFDPEQQRLRCLAMQEKARNRKTSSSMSAPTSSVADELPSSEASSSPQSDTVEQTHSSLATQSAGETLTCRHAEVMDAAAMHSKEPSNGAGAMTATVSTTTLTGRPLRSTRSASRPLTSSATRVPPSRGRALSLNDIIAARKIDLPLSLTDQLRLADTVNKKHNEKTLARYKITKIQRPYERPPSPDRHDHEPEACIITDDLGSHRQGKGDLAPYSTPTRSSSSYGSGEGVKRVRWYRPLFVGKGARYGIRCYEGVKPALKPMTYGMDRLGNKVATGNSPKLSKGQSIVIYRNYFKGEPEPADS